MGMTCRLSFSLMSKDSRKELATRSRASSGHGCQGQETKDCEETDGGESMQKQTADPVEE